MENSASTAGVSAGRSADRPDLGGAMLLPRGEVVCEVDFGVSFGVGLAEECFEGS